LSISVQSSPIDVAAETQGMLGAATTAGAQVTFLGLVRDLPEAPLQELFLEHYPGMTERALEQVEAEARQRWPLLAVRMVHRYGALAPQEVIVFVGVMAAHRREAFEACEFLMDALKSRVPFWKKETSTTQSRWVASRESDHEALERWTLNS
jgi:molybdopterin synthase catalytic subunit